MFTREPCGVKPRGLTFVSRMVQELVAQIDASLMWPCPSIRRLTRAIPCESASLLSKKPQREAEQGQEDFPRGDPADAWNEH